MEIKVRAVEGSENKSKAEVEEQLLQKHEEEQAQLEQNAKETETEKVEVEVEEASQEVEEKTTPSSELSDEDVLLYLKNRYDKDINSVDDLFAEKEANEPLPEDVSAYLKYKQETGRGINDFYELQKNVEQLLKDALEEQKIPIRRIGVKVSELSEVRDQSSITSYF